MTPFEWFFIIVFVCFLLYALLGIIKIDKRVLMFIFAVNPNNEHLLNFLQVDPIPISNSTQDILDTFRTKEKK